MKPKDLKKKDVVEFKYTNGLGTTISRDMVTIGGGNNGVLAIGGMFDFDLRNLHLLKVWREADNGEYLTIYDINKVDESKRYTILLIEHSYSGDKILQKEHVVADNQDDLEKIIKGYDTAWISWHSRDSYPKKSTSCEEGWK